MVPIEDVKQIFNLANSIVRVSCICRPIMLVHKKRYCYGISMGANSRRLGNILQELSSRIISGPESRGTETVSREEALSRFKEHEKEGFCHNVWTFRIPLIAAYAIAIVRTVLPRR